MIANSLRSARRSVYLLLAVGLAGCATSSHVIVGKVRLPIPPEEVRIYLHPPTKYEEVAIIDASSRNSWAITDQGKTDTVIRRLKEQAARLGANGILINGISEQNGGSVAIGSATTSIDGRTKTGFGTSIATPILLRETSGMAIFVIQE